MKLFRLTVPLVALAVVGVSCKKRAQPVDAGADDAKVRPEVAVARQGASASPGLGEPGASPTPSP